MNDRTLLLDPANIQLDPDNPPSRTKNTVDLQMALLATGRQIHRVVVVEPEEDKFQVVSGNRRVVACRALGWQVRAVKLEDATDEEIGKVSAAGNVQRELTPVEKAYELRRFMTATNSTLNVARKSFGLKTNDARMLMHLLSATPEIQQKVDSGKMSFTAFNEWCKAPPEVKTELKDGKDGKITASEIKQARRKARVEKAERMMDDESYLVELVQVVQRNLTILRGAAPFGNGVTPQIKRGLDEIGRLVVEIEELL